MARHLEMHHMWVRKRPETFRDWWDHWVISARSFPQKYWDKQVKQRVCAADINTFPNVAVCRQNFHLVMSLGAMFFGDRFCVSRKDETGGGGWVHPKGADSIAIFGLSFGNTLAGNGWAVSVLLYTNGLRK